MEGLEGGNVWLRIYSEPLYMTEKEIQFMGSVGTRGRSHERKNALVLVIYRDVSSVT